MSRIRPDIRTFSCDVKNYYREFSLGKTEVRYSISHISLVYGTNKATKIRKKDEKTTDDSSLQ